MLLNISDCAVWDRVIATSLRWQRSRQGHRLRCCKQQSLQIVPGNVAQAASTYLPEASVCSVLASRAVTKSQGCCSPSVAYAALLMHPSFVEAALLLFTSDDALVPGIKCCSPAGALITVSQAAASATSAPPALQLERQQRSYRWQQQMEQTLTVEQLQAMAVSWQELLQDARLHRGILDVPVQECKLLTPAQRT